MASRSSSSKSRILRVNQPVTVLAPTITKIPASGNGSVVVSASHGGAYPGYLAAASGIRAVILNDAGVGRDDAGIGALAICESVSMAAATVSAESARIGDADDMIETGIVSHCNGVASAVGVRPGQSCAEAAGLLGQARMPATKPQPYAEARTVMAKNPAGLDIVCIDSVSLVVAQDEGAVVVTGSHGGVVGGNPALAIRVEAAAAFYNDAGVGKDRAGITRLAALDSRGIVAATVSAQSARIGDGKNTYDDGIVSHTNVCAQNIGIEAGMPLKTACSLVPAREKS